MNFDERQELVQVVGKAVARRADQLVINALAGAGVAAANQVGTNIGGSGSNLNIEKLIAAKKTLDTQNVPMEDRFMLVHAANLAGLLAETEVTSSDFNTVKALVQGQLDTFLGFKIITIGDRDEGGLVGGGSGQTRKVWAWHKSAVGMAEGMGIKSEINYIPEKTSWLVASMFSAGAVAIDNTGVVEITCTE